MKSMYLLVMNRCIVEQARNLTKRENIPLSINHYLKNMGLLTNQWNSLNYKQSDRQRIYLKDIDCPQVWHDKLKEQIPPAIFYLNDSTGNIGGPGSIYESGSHGPGNKKGRGVARAGDLMSSLPSTMRADNLMCYIGHEGTYTPAHREMCASLGQNVMVEASGAIDEDGKPSKPGSSIWFMTETKDRHLVSEYWLSTLGHDIEIEAHFAQINAWKAAPFTTYIVEQKVGDFILIPPLAPHQVWNRGTKTIKVAWNRTTVETLEMALHEALPRARMVCRDEQYKNKAIIYYTLQKYSALLDQAGSQKKAASDITKLEISHSPKIRQLQKDFRRLFALYTEILLSEMLAPVAPTEKSGQYIPYDSNITCSYCRANIFNRFLTCTSCTIPLENDEDTYDICMDCYAMGRSCRCISKLRWVEQFPWRDLVDKHDHWRHQIIEMEGGLSDASPQPLHIERKRLNKKTLAQVCQEQLKLRPWRDPKKADAPEMEEKVSEEDEVNDDGSIKKRRKKRRSEKWLSENLNCHICKHRDPLWKLAVCVCGTAYCYGSLWRAFDMIPQSIMEDPDWECPKCRKICSCAVCRKDSDMRPFEPNGTVLGHDTKQFADPRSVESLVDFSHSNISWVKKAGDDHPHDTRRLRRRQDEAETAKSRDQALDAINFDEESPPPIQIRSSIVDLEADSNIDPRLNDRLIPHSPRFENQLMPTVARQALQAMNGMSSLERDPEGFKLLAGIDGSRNPTPPLVSIANMVDQPHRATNSPKLTADGVTYEYPDPSLPIGHNATQAIGFTPLNHFPQNEPAVGGQKRKRMSDAAGVQFNLPPPPKSNANSQYVQAQTRQTMAKAQKNDRRISAEAAMSGKQLILKLPLDFAKMTARSPAMERRQSSDITTLGGEKEIGVPLLQSDLPPEPSAVDTVTPRTELPKRRPVRLETDEDFSLGRSLKRKYSGIDKLTVQPTSTVSYAEISDGSEDDDGLGTSARKTNLGQRRAKGRPLPTYLARRRDSGDANIPKELPSDVCQRSSKKRVLSPRHPVPSEDTLAVDRGDQRSRNGSNTSTSAGNSAIVSPAQTDQGPGPGKSSRSAHSLNLTAQENLKAKMKAFKSVQSDASTNDSERDSPEIILAENPKKVSKDTELPTQHRRLPINGGPPLHETLTKQIPRVERRSIFSKPGVKIKVTSVKMGIPKSRARLTKDGVLGK